MTANKAAHLIIINVSENSSEFGEQIRMDDNDKAILQKRLDDMTEGDYVVDTIFVLAANIRLSGAEPMLSSEVLDTAKDSLYEGGDIDIFSKVRQIGSQLSVLAARDIRRISEGMRVDLYYALILTLPSYYK